MDLTNLHQVFNEPSHIINASNIKACEYKDDIINAHFSEHLDRPMNLILETEPRSCQHELIEEVKWDVMAHIINLKNQLHMAYTALVKNINILETYTPHSKGNIRKTGPCG
ncbi:hypothetical protein HHI36_005400 [Cryptolaemus montrouzieri]|uniref:Uncharacterized protein n=1 Tax=Cryptolaemus montrouzieri TaxID=559131 RepID=A0ABD2NV29_9CUCU